MILTTKIATGIHIDSSHGLGRIDNKIATRFQHYLSTQRLVDLILDAKQVEYWAIASIGFQLRSRLGDKVF